MIARASHLEQAFFRTRQKNTSKLKVSADINVDCRKHVKQVQNEGEIHRNSKDESAFNNRLEAPFGSIIHKIFRKILKTTIRS